VAHAHSAGLTRYEWGPLYTCIALTRWGHTHIALASIPRVGPWSTHIALTGGGTCA
jgi:hypothetical protein